MITLRVWHARWDLLLNETCCSSSKSNVTHHPFFRRLTTALGLILLAAAAVGAQSVDIIRGRVLGPDTLAVPSVLVTATTLTGNVSRTARTDRNGRYQISFPGGEGNYWVSFTALGFTPRRYQLLRTADQEILIADARMSPATVTLESVRVSGQTIASRSDTISDVSGTERAVTADPGFLTAEQMGDLAAMAASIPGVQLLLGADGAADAFSVFGLGGDQNNTQLNGLNFGDATVPRDASVRTTLSTSTYDVARGGFSGGQLQVRTSSGSNFRNRALSSNLIAPPMQWMDKAGLATAQQYTNLSLGGSASGPLKPDQAFYSSSFQLDRRLQDLQTLLNSDDLGFQTVGVAADSVTRLLTILHAQQAPFNVAEYSSQRVRDVGSFLGSFDVVQPNSTRGNTFTATLSGNVNRTSPVGNGQTALFTPSRDGTRSSFGGSSQLRHSGQVGLFGLFTETTFGYNLSQNTAEPFVNLPAGTVRVNSSLEDGSASVRALTFAGSTNLNTASQNATLAGNNTLSWFSSDNRHRVKLTSELRRDSYWQDFTQNQLGTFTYNSLAELDANVPASFTRQLAPRRRSGSQMVGAMSLGDAWRPTNDVQIQYGARIDGNKYLAGPDQNSAVQSAFGRDNSVIPNTLYLSPRVGFSWTYGQADQLTLLPGMARAPRAVVRGGFGVFQNTPGLQLIQGAVDNTGLPSGLQALTCLGIAAPIPDWARYAANVNSIPTNCADGTSGTVFSNSAPNVTLFSPGYLAQRSLRSNLQWSGAILKNRLSATVDATWSRNQLQPGGIDINFPGRQHFDLANEGNRPIYVPVSSIVPTTGAIAWRGSRVVETYGRVTEQRSDLQSESRQLTLSIRPISFSSRWGWSLSYVLADVREQYNGFTSTVADPRSRDWSPGQNFSRHQVQYSWSYNWLNTMRISWSAGLRSGILYSPLVQGDVNGDSFGNDRAFIYNPATASDPLVAAGMHTLLATGTREATACLRSQLGKLAGRNSCEGPWTMSGNLGMSFNSLRIGLPQRANLSVQITNPLGGIDRLLNGEDHLKGWGMNIQPEQQLLYVRGFDAATRSFRYEVNERFGSTRPSQNPFRTPTSITAILRFDIGPAREQQQLMQQLDRGRTRPGNKPTLQQLRGTANVGLINPMQQLLQQADSLKLTRRQADSIATLNHRYVLKSDSIWTPVARFLADLPDRFNHGAAYDKYKHAREQTVDLLIHVAPDLRRLITAAQYRLLPTQLAGFMDKRTLIGIRSGTAGSGGGGGFGGFGGGGGGGGGRGGGGGGRGGG